MTPRCPSCGGDLVQWDEVTLMVEAPNWWPRGAPYDPPPTIVRQDLCLRCGHHTETKAEP